MTSHNLENRVHKLESKNSGPDVILKFSNGVVRLKDSLALCVSGMDRVSPRLRDEPIPATPYDELIDLMGSAVEVQSGDCFISGAVHEICMEAVNPPTKVTTPLAGQQSK